MQNSGDALLAAAVEAPVQTVVHKLEVDWARNGAYAHALSDLTKVVVSAQIDRRLNGSLPQETTMVEGFSTARMSVTLSGIRPGDTDPIAKLLSPWNISAPLFGDGRLSTPVRMSIGNRVSSGVETMPRQFTGVVSEFTVDSRTGTISMICLDSSETLHSSVSLPAFALSQGTLTKPQADWRINSQWMIDYVLRKNGIYASPPPQTGCIYSNTGHGALIPEIGHWPLWGESSSFGIRTADQPVTYPGRTGWGLAYGGDRNGAPTLWSRGRPGIVPQAGTVLTVQAQIDTSKVNSAWWGQTGEWMQIWFGPNFAGSLGGINLLFTLASSGQLLVAFCNQSTIIAQPFSTGLVPLTGIQDVWYKITFGTPLSNSSVQFSTGDTASVNLSTLNTALEVWPFPRVKVSAFWPMQDIQICNATGVGGTTLYDPTTWVPQADLDEGLLTVSGLPIRRDVDSWELVKEVAQAEYGTVGFDESGRFFFRNRDNVRRGNLTIEKTLTESQLIGDLGLSERTGSVRNIISTKVRPRFIKSSYVPSGYGGVPMDVVFKPANIETIVCEPGNSAHQLQMDTPGFVYDSTDSTQIAPADWPPDTTSLVNALPVFSAVRQGQTGIEQTGVLLRVITLPPEYGHDQVLLLVYNPGIYPILFGGFNGDPGLWIAGRKYVQDTDTDLTVRRESSISTYGARSLELPTSDWLQQESSVGAITRGLLKDLRAPTPVIQNLVAVGDCRVQLADTVSVRDTGIIGGPMYTAVDGISRSLTINSGGAQLVDRYDVRPFSSPGKWILGHPTQSILGSTTKL